MLKVYEQKKPIPTGERFTKSDGGSDVWHRADLREVGIVKTWAEAKKLCRAPIVEKVGALH
jgi:hypothetical protein